MNIDATSISSIITGVYGLAIILLITTIILERGNPTRTLAWCLVLILMPIIGFVLYLFFGQKLRKKSKFKKKLHLSKLFSRKLAKTLGSYPNHLGTSIENNSIIRQVELLKTNSGTPLTKHNKVAFFDNGMNLLDSLLECLNGATHSIHIMSYIIEKGRVWDKIEEVLFRKASEGVKIRIIVDDMGSWSLNSAFFNNLRKHNIEIAVFMPVRFTKLTSKLNYRNHRKITVIDGKIGYIGGFNLADKYFYDTVEYKKWKDMHIQIKGEGVNILQYTFLTDWFFITRKEIILKKEYYPEAESVAKNKDVCYLQIAISGPDAEHSAIMQSYISMLHRAKKCINIATPYFIPTESILETIKIVALSGIKINLLMPKKGDSSMVHLVSLTYIQELLAVGVRVYLYEAGFMHAKFITIDDFMCSVGSVNLDTRSLNLNLESTTIIYNSEKTVELNRYFNDCLSRSTELKVVTFRFIDKIKSSIYRLFSPLL